MADDAQHKNINRALQLFSDNLIPTDQYLKTGIGISEKIFILLQTKARHFSIDRVIFGGSIGKHTSIINSDFDLYVFINNSKPPFTEALSEIEDILTLADIEMGKITKYSIQFKSPDGFTVDLLPAANLIPNHQRCNLAGEDLAKLQQEYTLQKMSEMKQMRQNWAIYSSSLVETQMLFMKKQDSFCHQIARLAKFWYKTLLINEYIWGAKTIIELIAVDAAKKEDSRSSRSMLRAFRSFLESVANIDTIKIAFDLEDGSPIPIDILRRMTNSFSSDFSLPSKEIFQKRNFIIEPANAFNDLSNNLRRPVVRKLKGYANESIIRFQKVYTITVAFYNGEPYLPFDKLFQPMPKVLMPSYDTKAPDNFLLSIENGGKLNPDMKIRNERKLKSPLMQVVLKGIQQYLLVNVNSFSGSKPTTADEEMKTSLKSMIDENILGIPRHQWVSSSDDCHEDYDVTFTVPFKSGPNKISSAVVSVKWD